MGYCSCCALVLSPEGEKAFQSAVKVIIATLGEEDSEGICSLVEAPDEKHECEGSVLRIWKENKWYLEFSEVSFLDDFKEEHWNDHWFLRYGENLDDYENTGGFQENPFEIGINREFSFHKPESTYSERHSNGLMVLKMVGCFFMPRHPCGCGPFGAPIQFKYRRLSCGLSQGLWLFCPS